MIQSTPEVHAPAQGHQNPKSHPMTSEDIWRLLRVGAPAISGDGQVVITAVTSYDMEKNEGRSRLWRISPNGGEPRPVTTADLSSREPALSPDGTRLAFVRSAPGEKPQLHVMPLDGGEPEKLTDLPMGCYDPRWFPDGKRIAVLANLYKDAPTPAGTRELMETRQKEPVKAIATEDRLFRFWDRWLTDGDVPHLFVLDLESRELRDLTPETRRWFELMDPGGQYDISPDGKEIAFSANSSEPPHERTNWDIFTLDVASGAIKNLTAGNPLDDSRPRYSPDGKHILYGMQVQYGFYADKVRLVLFERATDRHIVLTESWDRSAAGWEFSPKSGRIVFHAEDRGRVAIYTMGLEAGVPTEVHRGGNIAGISVASDATIYFAQDSVSSPPEAACCAEDGSNFRWISGFNAGLLQEIQRGEVRERTFAGADGAEVQMFLVFPPGFDEKNKYPLVHMIHGGPHGMFGDQFHFRWNAHAFAAPGYVVALVNFHGSTSWGQEFARCILGGWGDRPYRDIMAATDLLEKEPWIDPTRMAATGGSYGGYMVSWIAGHTDRFTCLVNHAGVSDLLGQWASDVAEGREVSMGGSPWENLDRMDEWNPIRHASNFKSPMLVLHGERDYRVPYTQGLQIYSVYKGMGLPARLVVFPDENHWVLKPRNSRMWFGEVLGWLGRYLGPGKS